MATAPTPEEVAKMILARFKSNNSRVGHVLQGGVITSVQIANNLAAEELKAGLIYAGEQGWIDNAGSTAISLTEAGFEAM